MRRSVWLVSALVVVAVIVVAGIALTHHRSSSQPAVTPVVSPKTEVQTAPIVQTTPQPLVPPAETKVADPAQKLHVVHVSADADEAKVFTLLAEDEISQLVDGITLGKWLEVRGTPEQWEKVPEKQIEATDGVPRECATYRRSDELPSKIPIIRTAYFYPPPVPSPAIFPGQSAEELRNTCRLGEVDLELGRYLERGQETFTQAVLQEFTQQYGESVGSETPCWGLAWHRNFNCWVHNPEIIAGDSAGSEHVFAKARLPLVQETHGLRSSQEEDHATRARAVAEFNQAVTATGVDASLSQRMQKQYDLLELIVPEKLAKQLEEMCKTHCPGSQAKMPKPTKEDLGESLIPLLQDWFAVLKPDDLKQMLPSCTLQIAW